MKKLIVALSLVALTLPVFAAQSESKPAAQEQTQSKKKATKKTSKKHKKSTEQTGAEKK